MVNAQEVAIIILNYQNAGDTIECLQSLLKLSSKPRAIIVVDNASQDNSEEKIIEFLNIYGKILIINQQSIDSLTETENNKFFFIKAESNNGYAAGNNIGIRIAEKLPNCKAFWILNNDTIVNASALDFLCSRYNEFNKPALIGSTIVFNHDKKSLQCTAGSKFFPFFGLNKNINQDSLIDDIQLISRRSVERKLGFILGASIFIHKSIIEKIGLFKEDFFLYEEEAEFCVRARKAHYPLLWAPFSIVFHKEGSTTKSPATSYKKPEWVVYLLRRNRTRVVIEHYPFAFPILFLSFILVFIRDGCMRGYSKKMLCKAFWHGLINKMGFPHKYIDYQRI